MTSMHETILLFYLRNVLYSERIVTIESIIFIAADCRDKLLEANPVHQCIGNNNILLLLLLFLHRLS
jgi:hypothetical protein